MYTGTLAWRDCGLEWCAVNRKAYKKSPHLGTIITKAEYTPNKDAAERRASDYAIISTRATEGVGSGRVGEGSGEAPNESNNATA